MMRPQSIIRFEWFYLASFVVGLAQTALNWSMMMATLDADPSVAPLGASVVTGLAIGVLVIGAIITLLLWYFVARQGSIVAKWIVTAFFAFALLSFLRGLLTGGMSTELVAIIGLVGFVLHAAAVWMLFRPDAKAWFAPGASEPTA